MIPGLRNPDAQLRAVVRACGGPDSLIGSSPATAAWLMCPTTSAAPQPSEDNLRLSFLLNVRCYSRFAGPALPDVQSSFYEALIVPHETVADGRAVLCRSYGRVPRDFFDNLPQSMVLEHAAESGDMLSVVSHGVSDLHRSVYCEVQWTRNNSLMLLIIGPLDGDNSMVSQCTVIDANGNVEKVLESRPICQFCDAKCVRPEDTGSCECPETMRNRSVGAFFKPVVVNSWQSYIQVAKSKIHGGLLMCKPRVGTLPSDLPTREHVSLTFDGASIRDSRAAFLDHISEMSRSFASAFIGTEDLLSTRATDPSLGDMSFSTLFGTDSSRSVTLAIEDANDPMSDDQHLLPSTAHHLKHACPFCDAEFAKHANLKRHIEAIHERKREFRCSHCDISFAQNANLRRHEAAVHAKIKAFSCDLCSLAFGTSANYHRHLKSQRHVRALRGAQANGVAV